MKIFNKNHLAFTLIEVIVAVTILSIILISVMSIYITSTDINLKTDITRALQQNVKSVVEVIAEDIRKSSKKNISVEMDKDNLWDCTLTPTWNDTKSGVKLCIWSNQYYLAVKDIATWNYSRAEITDCDDIEEHCTIVKLNNKPLMNSWVDVKNLEFKISDNWVKKVTILMTLQPAIWKWIKPNLIKENRFHFQTTISERPNLN